MEGLDSKLVDEITAFTESRVWALVKYRLGEYCKNLDTSLHNQVRMGALSAAQHLEGKIEGMGEAIKVTECLASELIKGTLDVNAALGVIENIPK